MIPLEPTKMNKVYIYTQSSVSHTSVYNFLCLSYAVMFEMGLTRLNICMKIQKLNMLKFPEILHSLMLDAVYIIALLILQGVL